MAKRPTSAPRIVAAAILLAIGVGAFAQGGQGSGGQSDQAAQGKEQPDGTPAAAASASASGRAGADTGERPSSEARGEATRARAELEFMRWLDSYMPGGELETTRARLREMAAVAIEAGVSADAIKARIREAVAKRVSAETMLRAIEEDALRWRWVARLLDGSDWPPDDRAAELYLAVSTALRNGVGEGPVAGLVSWAKGTNADPAKAGAALAAAASISAAFRGAGAGDAALTLLRSRLRVRQYSAAVELAVRAREAGVTPERFMEALEATLGRGGSLRDLERALFG
ncbi:MAG TPA: hypothetical protein PLE25_13165 [Spirochaetales bacterium]|nr:hypothetical protein [Spirochaetales bacterium]